MKKIRYTLIALSLLLCSVTSATAGISIGIGLPNVSIGINLPLFPELVRVPGYPVYYAPRMDANYFFYDGMYWVFQDDNWYASSWYNGPWGIVDPEYVPLYILRIPVYYYRQPPNYFRGWHSNAPPRWGQHWGRDWERHRRGWDRWNRRSAPAPAPIPVYQRRYSGDRYPRQVEQQQRLRSRHYRYQPRDKIIRQHFREQRAPAPARRGRQEAPQTRSPREREIQRSTPHQPRGGENVQRPAPVHAPPQQRGPAIREQRSQPERRGGENVQRSAPVQTPHQQRGPAMQDRRQQPEATQRERQAPSSQGRGERDHDRGESRDPNRGHGQGDQKDEGRGRGHNN